MKNMIIFESQPKKIINGVFPLVKLHRIFCASECHEYFETTEMKIYATADSEEN